MTELVSPFTLEYAYKRSLGPVLSRFFTALRDGRIEGVATVDGRVLCPPTEYDPETGADVADPVEVGPAGTVRSWTWVDNPSPRDPLDRPFAWALIQLDGADTSLLHAVDAPKSNLRTGARVTPRWRAQRVGHLRDIEAFVLGESAAAPEPCEGEPVTRFKSPTRLEYVVTAGDNTIGFLEGILDGKLIGTRCPSCSKVYLPPRGACPICVVAMTEPVEVSQRGTVTTFSIVRFPFEGQALTPPYACAHILLDGADVPLLHVVGDCDVDTVRMGMRVGAVWVDDIKPTLASVRYFHPVDEPDTPYEQFEEYV
jgi:uncharacterized protein